MTPEHIIFESVARRLDAGTYLPRQRNLHPATPIYRRPLRRYAFELALSSCIGGMIGFMLGGGLS